MAKKNSDRKSRRCGNAGHRPGIERFIHDRKIDIGITAGRYRQTHLIPPIPQVDKLLNVPRGNGHIDNMAVVGPKIVAEPIPRRDPEAQPVNIGADHPLHDLKLGCVHIRPGKFNHCRHAFGTHIPAELRVFAIDAKQDGIRTGDVGIAKLSGIDPIALVMEPLLVRPRF